MDARIKRMRLEQWVSLLEEQAKSGLSKKDWCEQNGIRKWEFYRRQRECRDFLLQKSGMNEGDRNLPVLVEIPLDGCECTEALPIDEKKYAMPAHGNIDVSYNGFQISLGGHADPETLTTLIKAVANA